MPGDTILELRMNPTFKQQMREIQLAACTQVFEQDILPKAVADSPVTPDGIEWNIKKLEAEGRKTWKNVEVMRTGHNRQSLATTVEETPEGVEAKLFSQSGYGGYLEIGTSKMRAQPYIWPAFLAFKDKISAVMKEMIGAL